MRVCICTSMCLVTSVSMYDIGVHRGGKKIEKKPPPPVNATTNSGGGTTEHLSGGGGAGGSSTTTIPADLLILAIQYRCSMPDCFGGAIFDGLTSVLANGDQEYLASCLASALGKEQLRVLSIKVTLMTELFQ